MGAFRLPWDPHSNVVGTDRPMHACLNVDEIIRLIVHEVVESKANATAVALACCRQSFEDPVLDVLWETQNKLIPVLNCLPGDVWKGDGCTAFNRSPTTQEWTRFRKYAQRMRELRERGSLRVLSPEVFLALSPHNTEEPLFPRIKSLALWSTGGKFISFVPLFLSPGTTTINISFNERDFPAEVAAPIIAGFPILCPNLQKIDLSYLPRDPMVTAAVSLMLLLANRNTLQFVYVESPLIEEAREVIHKLPNLRGLSVLIEEDDPLPLVVLPNLTDLIIRCEDEGGWLRMFEGATFGKLDAITFDSRWDSIGDFLEEFERVAVAASVQKTLSKFHLYTSFPWASNYSALLPFTQLTELVLDFHCDGDCSSTVDDETIMNLARAMPKLETLQMGGSPCRKIPIGVTAKGLAVLADHCPDLSTLRVHFRVATLRASSATTSNARSTTVRRDCGLKELEVGKIPLSERSVSTVALTLGRMFPRIERIDHVDGNWQKVADAIVRGRSRQIVDHSGAASENGS